VDNDELDGDANEEEAPVLPKEILKHKLELEHGRSSGKNVVKRKRNKKAPKTPAKKQKGT